MATPSDPGIIPAPSDTVKLRMADGALVMLRRHGNPSGPRMLFSHGNALAADLYYPFWSSFTDRFDLFIYDVRSHGWNPAWDRQTHNFSTFISDSQCIVREIDARYGAKPLIGVLHSISALVALLHQLQAEEEEEGGFAALVLLDVPVCPPGRTVDDNVEIGEAMAERARRRKIRFDSREDFVVSASRSRLFQRFRPAAIELLAQTTLRPDGDGGYELRCPREHEAQIVEYYFGWAMQVYDEIERVGLSCPVKAIGSDPTLPFAYMPGIYLDTLAMLDYDFIPDSTHFLPLEVPEECASMTVTFLGERGLV